MKIEDKCKIVADSFQWWATTANKYLEEDSWTEGRIQFVEERFAIHERIENAFERYDWKLFVPGDVKAASFPLPFSVKLSVAVTGFRCKEYVHVLNPQDKEHLIIYRTKDKAKSLEQGSVVSGFVWANKKVLFAGRQFPVASKVKLK